MHARMDRVFQISAELPTPQAPCLLGLHARSFWGHSPEALETHILSVPSVFIPQNRDTDLFSREFHGSPCPLYKILERNNVCFQCVEQEWGWKSAGANYNYLFISEMWPVDVSVQTLVFSNAQLGRKLPSAPWAGSGQTLKGTEPRSITNVNCLVLPGAVQLVEISRLAQVPTNSSSAF